MINNYFFKKIFLLIVLKIDMKLNKNLKFLFNVKKEMNIK